MTENSRVFTCENCAVELDDVAQLKAHMKDVHNNTELKGTKEMVMHLDGADWYGGTNRWTFGEVEIIETYRYKRTPDTMMW